MWSNLTDIVLDGIDLKDYPDFVDAYIVSANLNGIPLSDKELDILNENRDFIYSQVLERIL